MPKEFESRDNSKNGSSNHFLLGALVGGVAGAIAALLLTPKTGRELRKTLNSQTGPLMEKTAKLGENVVNKSSSVVSGLVLNKGKKNAKPVQIKEEETEINYIPISSSEKGETKTISLNQDDLRRKIAETEKALEEEENKVKL